jgi:hypothetical protein
MCSQVFKICVGMELHVISRHECKLPGVQVEQEPNRVGGRGFRANEESRTCEEIHKVLLALRHVLRARAPAKMPSADDQSVKIELHGGQTLLLVIENTLGVRSEINYSVMHE